MPWGISWGEVALLLLSVWTVIGALGVFVSFMRGERNKAKRHLGWIAAIWLLYLAVLLTVSLTARRRQVAIGQEQCFGGICVAVLRATTIPGYLVQKGEQVVRVTVQISNHSSETQHDSRLTAYLVDDQGRRWSKIRGLEGVRLSTTIPPHGATISEPVYKVTGDATGISLVFTHGPGLPRALVIGDSDSLLHPPVVVQLEPSGQGDFH